MNFNDLVPDVKSLIFQFVVEGDKPSRSPVLNAVRQVCIDWRDIVNNHVLPVYYRPILANKGHPERTAAIDHIIHSASSRSLNECLEKGPEVRMMFEFDYKDSGDDLINEKLDIAVLILKRLLKSGIISKRKKDFREILAWVLSNENFSIYNTPNFFSNFTYAFFNRPCVLKSIRLWKSIVELQPDSKILDPQAFFSFLTAAESKKYSKQEIEEINNFFREFLDKSKIEIDVPAIVGQVYFPIVSTYLTEDAWYENYFRSDSCEVEEYCLLDLCALSESKYSVNNVRTLLEDPDISYRGDILELAVTAGNFQVALDLLNKLDDVCSVNPYVLEKAINLSLYYLSDQEKKAELVLRLKFLNKLIKSFDPESTVVKEYFKIRKQFLLKLTEHEKAMQDLPDISLKRSPEDDPSDAPAPKKPKFE